MTSPGNQPLGRGKLSMTGVLAQSVGFMGPVFSVAALLPLIVGLSATGRGAGVATPLAIIVAGAGIFGAGWIIAQYAKRIHLCATPRIARREEPPGLAACPWMCRISL